MYLKLAKRTALKGFYRNNNNDNHERSGKKLWEAMDVDGGSGFPGIHLAPRPSHYIYKTLTALHVSIIPQ